MNPKILLCLALVLSGGLFGWSRSEQSVGAADEGPSALLRVVVIPSKTDVRIREPFSLTLSVENATKTNQTVRVMNCSWDEEWQCSNPKIPWAGAIECTKNFAVDVEIRPGGAYTNESRMLEFYYPISDKQLSFRMGFTSIGSKKTNWSHEVKLRILPPNK